MCSIFYITIDSDVRNNLDKYFAPLKVERPTGEKPFDRLIQKMEQYHDQNAPKFWDEFKERIECRNRDSMVLLYLFERTEEKDDKIEILYGTWTELIRGLVKFNSVFQFGNIAGTRSSNEDAIREALAGIRLALNELNQRLKLDLPTIEIQD